jgi:hypothetical protein
MKLLDHRNGGASAGEAARPDAPAPARAGEGRPRRRRHQPSLVAAGVVLVAGLALAFAAYAGSIDDRVPVLVLRHSLPAGTVLTDADLRSVAVGADDAINATPSARRSELVGLVAIHALSAGTLVVDDHFATALPLPAGQVIVGAVVGPGAMPEPVPRAGEPVLVLAVPVEGAPADTEAPGASVWSATVFAVTEASSADSLERGWAVSLAVERAVAPEVAAAAAGGRVRLALVPHGGTRP